MFYLIWLLQLLTVCRFMTYTIVSKGNNTNQDSMTLYA